MWYSLLALLPIGVVLFIVVLVRSLQYDQQSNIGYLIRDAQLRTIRQQHDIQVIKPTRRATPSSVRRRVR